MLYLGMKWPSEKAKGCQSVGRGHKVLPGNLIPVKAKNVTFIQEQQGQMAEENECR